jgi:hypothetical protein
MPFNELQTLYDSVQAGHPDSIVPGAQLTLLDTTPVAMYYCPTRRSPSRFHGDAVTDYGGSAGSNHFNGVIIQIDGFGATGMNRGYVQIPKIRDGMSNTMMYGERRLNLATMQSGQDSADDEPSVRCGGDLDSLRWAHVSPATGIALTPSLDLVDRVNTNLFGGGWRIPQFGSSHAGAMNAASADGSVRRIHYGVDPTAFRRLCERADGQPFDPGQLE